jgi:succinate dehydrogenase / fumarate reductase iron-sulfur subunit
MRVNGKAKWPCRLPVSKAAVDGEITLDPPRLVKEVKDLVYDQDEFLLDKYSAVKPWLESSPPSPTEEHIVSQEKTKELQEASSCTLCGMCDEGCTVLVIDKTFLGPAALTKAFKPVADPRDRIIEKRLDELSQKRGMWDCVHCFEATEHCPKGIDPTDRILSLRDEAIKRGIGTPRVVRHNDSFAKSVRNSGWLDEARLAIESEGLTNIGGLMHLVPTAAKAMAHRKAPLPYLHKKRPGAKQIKRIFEKWEGEDK